MLQRISNAKFHSEGYSVLSVRILRDYLRRKRVYQRQQLSGRRVVFRPRQSSGSVRVKVIHEIDEVVREVAWSVHVQDVAAV